MGVVIVIVWLSGVTCFSWSALSRKVLSLVITDFRPPVHLGKGAGHLTSVAMQADTGLNLHGVSLADPSRERIT